MAVCARPVGGGASEGAPARLLPARPQLPAPCTDRPFVTVLTSACQGRVVSGVRSSLELPFPPLFNARHAKTGSANLYSDAFSRRECRRGFSIGDCYLVVGEDCPRRRPSGARFPPYRFAGLWLVLRSEPANPEETVPLFSSLRVLEQPSKNRSPPTPVISHSGTWPAQASSVRTAGVLRHGLPVLSECLFHHIAHSDVSYCTHGFSCRSPFGRRV